MYRIKIDTEFFKQEFSTVRGCLDFLLANDATDGIAFIQIGRECEFTKPHEWALKEEHEKLKEKYTKVLQYIDSDKIKNFLSEYDLLREIYENIQELKNDE